MPAIRCQGQARANLISRQCRCRSSRSATTSPLAAPRGTGAVGQHTGGLSVIPPRRLRVSGRSMHNRSGRPASIDPAKWRLQAASVYPSFCSTMTSVLHGTTARAATDAGIEVDSRGATTIEVRCASRTAAVAGVGVGSSAGTCDGIRHGVGGGGWGRSRH